MKKKITPTHIDGGLYVLMAVCASLVASASTDDAVKFVSPAILFWIKTMAECVGAGAGALKMFRSTSYAQSVQGAPAVPPPQQGDALRLGEPADGSEKGNPEHVDIR